MGEMLKEQWAICFGISLGIFPQQECVESQRSLGDKKHDGRYKVYDTGKNQADYSALRQESKSKTR